MTSETDLRGRCPPSPPLSYVAVGRFDRIVSFGSQITSAFAMEDDRNFIQVVKIAEQEATETSNRIAKSCIKMPSLSLISTSNIWFWYSSLNFLCLLHLLGFTATAFLPLQYTSVGRCGFRILKRALKTFIESPVQKIISESFLICSTDKPFF